MYEAMTNMWHVAILYSKKSACLLKFNWTVFTSVYFQ